MPPPSRIYHHITNQSTTVVDCLVRHFKQTPESAQDLIALGAIYHNKLRVLENLMLEKGAYLRLHLKPKRYAVDHIDWKTRVVAQTPDYVVIDKPAGVPTHATVDNLIENALAQTRIATGKELLATQRLDVPVSGLLVFAVNKNFQTYFNKLLTERRVKKIYCALSYVQPPQGLAVHYTENSERAPRRFLAEEKPQWLKCELRVLNSKPIQTAEKTLYASEVELLTGRTHQIRGQFHAMKTPLIGDGMYGGKNLTRDEIGLRCVELNWPSGPHFSLPREPWIEAFVGSI